MTPLVLPVYGLIAYKEQCIASWSGRACRSHVRWGTRCNISSRINGRLLGKSGAANMSLDLEHESVPMSIMIRHDVLDRGHMDESSGRVQYLVGRSSLGTDENIPCLRSVRHTKIMINPDSS